MDPLSRCDNGHYYDSKKHTSCPFCGVKNLDISINKTMAKRPSAEADFEPAAASDVGANKTVGIFKKKLGLDPVVGWLVATDGPEKGKDYRITAERNFIGRSETMDISIQGDETISRENHTVVSFNPKNLSFLLFPGDSRGLTYLNDEEVVAPTKLNPYDVIEIGQSRLTFIPFCGEKFQWKKAEDSTE